MSHDVDLQEIVRRMYVPNGSAAIRVSCQRVWPSLNSSEKPVIFTMSLY